MSNNEFILVKNKKKKKGKKIVLSNVLEIDPPKCNDAILERLIQEEKEHLRSRNCFESFEKKLKSIGIKNIISYGLGSARSSRISRSQTSLLLLIKDFLSVNVETFDPLFTDHDGEILSKLGIKMLRQNEVGKRTVSENTLFYMPHCGVPLYNNLLSANWSAECLSKCTIIGNSFLLIIDRVDDKILNTHFKYIKNVKNIYYETTFTEINFFEDDTILNDVSLIQFDVGKCDEKMWTLNEPPCYDGYDAEIIFT